MPLSNYYNIINISTKHVVFYKSLKARSAIDTKLIERKTRALYIAIEFTIDKTLLNI